MISRSHHKYVFSLPLSLSLSAEMFVYPVLPDVNPIPDSALAPLTFQNCLIHLDTHQLLGYHFDVCRIYNLDKRYLICVKKKTSQVHIRKKP